MKRFYCTICKRVIRVRKYPANVSTPEDTMPTNRIGSCNFHTRSTIRRDSINQNQKVGV